MTDTTKQELSLLDHNPGVLSLKISEHCRDGWRVDPDRPMTLLGFLWEVWLLRDASDEQLAADAEEAAKPSRAEILANARAKKAEKAKQAEKQIDATAEAVKETTAPQQAAEAPKEDAPSE